MEISFIDATLGRADSLKRDLPRVHALMKGFLDEPLRDYSEIELEPDPFLFVEWLLPWCRLRFEPALMTDLLSASQRDLSELELRGYRADSKTHHRLLDLDQIPEVHPSLRMIWAHTHELRVWLHWLDLNAEFREWEGPDWVALGLMKMWMEEATMRHQLEGVSAITGVAMSKLTDVFLMLSAEGAIQRRFTDVA